MFCFRRFAQSIGFLLVVFSMLFCSPSLYPYIYRGFERRWEFSCYINLSCLKLWFFTLDPLPDLIIVLWRTNFKSIPFEKEQCLQQCYCYTCLDVETKLQRWWLQSSWLYNSYTVLVNSGEVASGEMLLMTIASDDLASDDVSSRALLQTHFFRRISSDAFFQTLYASNKIPLLFDLFNQNPYE